MGWGSEITGFNTKPGQNRLRIYQSRDGFRFKYNGRAEYYGVWQVNGVLREEGLVMGFCYVLWDSIAGFVMSQRVGFLIRFLLGSTGFYGISQR